MNDEFYNVAACFLVSEIIRQRNALQDCEFAKVILNEILESWDKFRKDYDNGDY